MNMRQSGEKQDQYLRDDYSASQRERRRENERRCTPLTPEQHERLALARQDLASGRVDRSRVTR